MAETPKTMDADAAKAYLETHASDAYHLVDVREPWEYKEMHLPGAVLIPLSEVADRFREIALDKPTIVYCRSGRRSASAASLMAGLGFEKVFNLAGGVLAWNGEYAVGSWEAGLYHFTGKESPLQILGVAYAMEANLESFYMTRGAESRDPDVTKTFKQLARIEAGHRAFLVNVAKEVGAAGDVAQTLAGQGEITAAEGGWAPGDLLKERAAGLETPLEAVEAAMMFEAQALDLYLRSGTQVRDPEGRGLLQRLADQEKEHLKVLGRLLSRIP